VRQNDSKGVAVVGAEGERGHLQIDGGPRGFGVREGSPQDNVGTGDEGAVMTARVINQWEDWCMTKQKGSLSMGFDRCGGKRWGGGKRGTEGRREPF